MARRLIYNTRTGETKTEEFEFKPSPPPPEENAVSTKDVMKLIKYAKKSGWI